MSIPSAVSGLVRSVYDLFASLLATIYAVIHDVLSAVQSVLAGAVHFVQHVIGEAIHVTGGVTKFVLSNFVALAIGGLLVFGYLRYSTSGRQVAAGKKA
ncbi:hypothetical protein AAL_02012 [Moelleriella libera RCEF 2490]|uniref:Uncharacterized protein n=1 Tax=Moelleriella libera RCEF 2490 TaxID=1081109 RepID=A0A166PVZ4_9HYPO|nr:hypothetical protein AAL_02012 [Moelleriella libera RCEF 2490]